jgi:N-dimethylarginine dimethylaminohydrolase
VRGALATVLVAFALVAAAPPAQGWAARFNSGRQTAVLSDTDGTISEILLHYDGLLDEELGPVYETLFKTMPDNLHIRVLCSTSVGTDQFVEQWASMAAGMDRELSVIDVDQPISIWSRDRYIIRQTAKDPFWGIGYIPPDLPEYYYEKSNELKLFVQLGEHRLMPRAEKGHIHLEGGNIVANSRHAFIGVNVLEDNPLSSGASAFMRELEKLAGKRVFLVGNRDKGVPYDHVDMYLTPIDNSTVLLGSTRMSLELLFSRPAAEEGIDVAESLAPHLDDSTEIGDQFEAVARQLRGAGYRVLRVPALVDQGRNWMITYNNVLIDNQGDTRTVYMPVYQIPALDRVASAIYCELGFRVVEVDVSAVYEWGGAVRCLVNVTQRSPATLTRTHVTRRRTQRVRVHRINVSKEEEQLEISRPG